MFKKITFLIAAIFTVCFSFAQTYPFYSYLRVSFSSKNSADKKFVQLIAEPGNKYAADLYFLKSVTVAAVETADPVYSTAAPKRQTADSLFFSEENNAFRTVTEGLNFLAERNWELYLVENNIQTDGTTGYKYDNVITLPAIVSKPVYIFRKKVAAL